MEEAAGLTVILSALILLGLLLTARAWTQAMLNVFAAGRGGGIIRIINLPIRLIQRVVEPGLNYVTHKISVAASHYMHPLARFFDGLAALSLHTSVAVGLFAERTAIGFERLTTVVLPREIGRAVRPVERKALKALGLAGLTAAALHHLARQLRHAIYHDVLPRLHHLAHAIDVTIPREFGRIRSRVGHLEREIEHPSTRWLRRIATAMFVSTIAGLMIKTLARRFPWLFCRKVKTVGKRVCGLDTDLLGSLLTDTLLISGSISIVVFARELAAILRLFERLFLDFIGELKRVELDYLGHVEPVINLDNILSLTIPDDYFGPI